MAPWAAPQIRRLQSARVSGWLQWLQRITSVHLLQVVKASYNRFDQKGTDAAGASINANDASQFALGADYLPCKRTASYAHAARLSNKAAARFAIPGGPATVAAGSSSSGHEVGLRHSF